MKKFTLFLNIRNLIGLLVLLVVFASCEKENIAEKPIATEKTGVSQVVSKSDLAANKKLSAVLKQYISTNGGSQAPFTVFEEGAMYLEYGDYHSYTFYIEMDEPMNNHIKNLVLSSDGQDGYLAFIINYGGLFPIFADMPERSTFSINPSDQVYIFPNGKCYVMENIRQYTDGTFIWDWAEAPCPTDGSAIPYIDLIIIDPEGDDGGSGEGEAGPGDYYWPSPGDPWSTPSDHPGGPNITIVGPGGTWGPPEDFNPPTDDVATTPVSIPFQDFLYNVLNTEQRNWFLFDSTVEQQNQIKAFLNDNNAQPFLVFGPEDQEVVNYVLEVLDFLILHPSFNMDINRSFKSPYNIDLSAVKPDPNNPEPEKKRFMDIYDALTETSFFKDIFQATFGEDPNLNVSFEIADNIPSIQDPTKQANGHADLVSGTYNTTTNSINTVNIVIRINKQALVGVNKQSNITVARTILHESIHAFLTLKKLDSDAGATLSGINNKDLSMLINDMYNNFNSPNSDQHAFMFDHLVPTIATNLAAVKDEMIPQNEQDYYDGVEINDPTNPNFPETYFNWNDFFYYYSMEGLHNTQTFDDEIKSNSVKYFVYSFYITAGRSLSKN